MEAGQLSSQAARHLGRIGVSPNVDVKNSQLSPLENISEGNSRFRSEGKAGGGVILRVFEDEIGLLPRGVRGVLSVVEREPDVGRPPSDRANRSQWDQCQRPSLWELVARSRWYQRETALWRVILQEDGAQKERSYPIGRPTILSERCS